MKTAYLWMALVASPVLAANTPNVTGDWQGTLKVGASEMRIVLHVAGQAGGYTATMDSPDQGANGIAVSSISFQDSKLNFRVDAIKGSYEGRMSVDGATIEGTWSQGQQLALDFKRAAPRKTSSQTAKPSDIDGTWLGTLDTGSGAKLRIVIHITSTADGLSATMDSPDQGAKGLAATTATRNGSGVSIEWKLFGGKFEGKVSPDLTTIEGTWSQGGGTAPLVVKRTHGDAELERRRPQNPVKPYPYREEEVTFENRTASIKLAGTLTLPRADGGSRPCSSSRARGRRIATRALMGHRPFLVLADYLTRQGIAVLRADDRGFGKSGGDFATATTADFATDAEAAVAYLKSRPEIDPRRIGLIGHSEGGEIAPMVAARNPDVAFIVMMAGPGVPGDEILVAQTRLIVESNGMSHADAEKEATQEREILDAVKREKDDNALDKVLRDKLAGVVPEAQLEASLQQIRTPWFRYFLTYDPATALKKVRCPVLAINGEKDIQVPPGQNLPAIRKALESAGNRNFEVVELPGLNHLFQTAKTGAIGEYAEIEETISPVALEKIAGWLTAVASAAK